eukprot:81988-Chlamydomonas_euryale.AAC.6
MHASRLAVASLMRKPPPSTSLATTPTTTHAATSPELPATTLLQGNFAAFEEKMRAKGLGDAAVCAFKRNYDQLVAGATGLVPEADIEPVTELPDLRKMDEASEAQVKVRLDGRGGLKHKGGCPVGRRGKAEARAPPRESAVVAVLRQRAGRSPVCQGEIILFCSASQLGCHCGRNVLANALSYSDKLSHLWGRPVSTHNGDNLIAPAARGQRVAARSWRQQLPQV